MTSALISSSTRWKRRYIGSLRAYVVWAAAATTYDRYIVPMVVAIGPYHRHSPHLHGMEKVKRVAAHHFIRKAAEEEGRSYEEMYKEMYVAVCTVADKVRRRYANDVMARINGDDFARMMFCDACFLLQYMLCLSYSVGSVEDRKVDSSLRRFFFSNRACIENDVMLLENQLPWMVLDVLRKFSSVKIEEFIEEMGNKFQIREDLKEDESPKWDPKCSPPHLLGLLRLYKIRLGGEAPNPPAHDDGGLGSDGPAGSKETEAAHGHGHGDGLRQVSVSSAIELAEIGVRLKPSKTADFMDMGMMRGTFLGKLFLAPLSLDCTRASWLVNMAAFEVCTASRFHEDVNKTAVCSYIALLAMLMDREDDVHRLRKLHLVHGDHTNKEMLDFFKSLLKQLPDGGHQFARIMADIEFYKLNRSIRIKVYKFFYRYKKIMATVIFISAALAGIFKAVRSL